MTAVRAFAAAILLLAGAAPSGARDCRVPDAPPGVRVAAPPGCPAPAGAGPAPVPDPHRLRAGGSRGAVVLENGTEIRVGGRVRVDALGQR